MMEVDLSNLLYGRHGTNRTLTELWIVTDGKRD